MQDLFCPSWPDLGPKGLNGDQVPVFPAQNTIEHVMVYMGIVLVLMKTIMVSTVCDGFYWWDVKSYWKNAQNTLQNLLFKWFNWKKPMVYNGILMETIGTFCDGFYWASIITF